MHLSTQTTKFPKSYHDYTNHAKVKNPNPFINPKHAQRNSSIPNSSHHWNSVPQALQIPIFSSISKQNKNAHKNLNLKKTKFLDRGH